MGASVMGNGDLRMFCLLALVLLSGKCLFLFVAHCIACGYLLVGICLWALVVGCETEYGILDA